MHIPLLNKDNGEDEEEGFHEEEEEMDGSSSEDEDSPRVTTAQQQMGGEHCDVVQFSTPMAFVEEDEENFHIEVMRLGTLNGACKVHWQTEDGSAKAGLKYKHGEGTLSFGAGEFVKKITIEIINDDSFDTTVEFKVVLKDPENCVLGRYLHTCRAKIIDDDCFPTNKYREKLGGDGGELDVESIPGMMLMFEYMKLIFNLPGFKYKTIKILCMDQLHNLYYLLNVYLNIYMINVLFNMSEDAESELMIPGNRPLTVWCVAALYIGPLGLLHAWDTHKTKLDLSGEAREWLQSALFRKYLNYSEASHEHAPPSAIALAVIDEVGEVVDAGYMKIFTLFQVLGKLVIVIAFVVKENHQAVLPILLFLPALLTWIKSRNKRYVELGEDIAKGKESVVHTVHKACDNYRLIVDYHQRPHMVDVFDRKVEGFNRTKLPMDLMVLHNQYFPKWLSSMSTAFFVVMFAGKVFEKTLSVGTFIAMVKVFAELGEDFEEGYDDLMELSGAIGPLQKIVQYMNLETDLRVRKQVDEDRREKTHEFTHTLIRKKTEDHNDGATSPSTPRTAVSSARTPHIHCTSDEIPIKCIDVKFRYTKPKTSKTPKADVKWLVRAEDLTVPQGSLIAVVGPHKGAKTTLLKLISQTHFPQNGTIFIPSHLRVLNVSHTPTIMEMSLYHNLTFGDKACSPERVRRILNRLHMHKSLMKLVEPDLQKQETNREKRANSKGSPHANHAPHGQETPHPQTPRGNKIQETPHPQTPRGNKVGGHGVTSHDTENVTLISIKSPRDAQTPKVTGHHSHSSQGKSGHGHGGLNEPHQYLNQISYTDQCMVHLARALIANPEVMVLQRPFSHFDRKTQEVVMDVLRDHVNYSGLEFPEGSQKHRRPRTVFFSTDFDHLVQKADFVWRVDNGFVEGFDACGYTVSQWEETWHKLEEQQH